MRFAYADPPYPGMAARWYRNEPSFAGEVDHARLMSLLEDFDGWALSTSASTLRMVLPLCPEGARVCAWVKPIGVSSETFGLHNTWEPLIVFPGRRQRPGVRDWFRAMPARGGGSLPGRKPLAFCAFLFRALGMLPGDELSDLFPGTGIVGRSWAELSRTAAGDPSPRAAFDPSRRTSLDMSPMEELDPSLLEDSDSSSEASVDMSAGTSRDPSLPPAVDMSSGAGADPSAGER